jgi:hypothetical protein
MEGNADEVSADTSPLPNHHPSSPSPSSKPHLPISPTTPPPSSASPTSSSTSTPRRSRRPLPFATSESQAPPPHPLLPTLFPALQPDPSASHRPLRLSKHRSSARSARGGTGGTGERKASRRSNRHIKRRRRCPTASQQGTERMGCWMG